MNKFDEFVKKYAESREISIDEAMTHAQVKATQKYYQNAEDFEAQITEEVKASIASKL